MEEEFRQMNVELLGLSVDSLYSHIAWIRKIEELEWKGMKDVKINFPVIADLNTKVSTQYGMLQPMQQQAWHPQMRMNMHWIGSCVSRKIRHKQPSYTQKNLVCFTY